MQRWATVGFLLCLALATLSPQRSYGQVVQRSTSGNKAFLEINMLNLEHALDSLFSSITSLESASNASWSDVLSNGSNPGMDIDFSSYGITGIDGLTSTGTLTADSLILNKDADITGRLSVTDVVALGDSLTVSGYVEFADSLEVLRAVAIGETLHVTALTALGDSLHVVGNVDFDALFNVDGAATFSSTLTVAGETTLNDSLHVNSGARIVGTLYADSAVVEDVINGQVSSLSNHSTDGLGEGSANLYFTEQRAIEALSDTLAYLLQLIADLQNGSSDSPGTASFACGTSTVTFDGYDYSTIQIGDQCWFAENLRSTQFADGSAIPEVTDGTAWGSTDEGVRAAHNNDAGDLATYGYLYNWYAVDSAAGLCPTDWHVPTHEEWTTLTTELGGAGVAGGKMKSSSSDSPSWDGDNTSGFSGLPGGSRYSNGSFNDVGNIGYWWSSSPSYDYADYFYVNAATINFNLSNYGNQRNGFSVRCVQDADGGSSASAPTVTSSAASDLAETTATLNGAVDADGGDAVTATGFVWGTDALLSGASNASGSATSGSFTASLTDLTGGTTYYFSAYATNGEGTAHGDTLSFTTTPAAADFTCGTSTVTFDGHDYSTVEIGGLCWFAENLRSTQYADGSAIPEVTDDFDWAWGSTDEGVRAANNNDASNLTTYGYLYNWYAVDSDAGLCPTDWHVPTDEEWTALTTELGGESVAGIKMKSSSTDSPSWDGDNSSGFSGLPGGGRGYNGYFGGEGQFGSWWSASLSGTSDAWTRNISTDNGGVNRVLDYQQYGFSVRCLRDETPSSASAPTVTSSAASDLAETTATLNGAVDADGGDAVTATGFVWGTDALLSGASNASGSATSGSFTASLTDLTGGTTYYFSAYATNGEGTAHGDTLSFTTTPAAADFTCGTSTVTFDGHDYSTVEIGGLCWFAENLRSTQYADGSAIPEVTDGPAWVSTNEGARAAYDNDASNVATFGYLYNWHAVDNSAGLCPAGWVVPNTYEWTTLATELGGGSVAGAEMKSSLLAFPDWGGTNSSGFSGLPGGARSYFNGNYYDQGEYGYWWSASSSGASNAFYRDLSFNDDTFGSSSINQRDGASVRCLLSLDD